MRNQVAYVCYYSVLRRELVYISESITLSTDNTSQLNEVKKIFYRAGI